MPWIEPVTLEGEHVRLEPASLDRLDDVWRAADDPEIWTFIPFTMQRREDMALFIEYVILGRRIWSRSWGRWHPYTGGTSHDWHIHVSGHHGDV